DLRVGERGIRVVVPHRAVLFVNEARRDGARITRPDGRVDVLKWARRVAENGQICGHDVAVAPALNDIRRRAAAECEKKRRGEEPAGAGHGVETTPVVPCTHRAWDEIAEARVES